MISEAVLIDELNDKETLNSKTEWNYVKLPRAQLTSWLHDIYDVNAVHQVVSIWRFKGCIFYNSSVLREVIEDYASKQHNF